MKPFLYFRPKTVRDAIAAVASDPDARFIAGGTNLIDLMKRGVVSAGKLVDINHLPLKKIEQKGSVLRIGALTLNSEVAMHKAVLQKHPLLVQALNAGASGQLRNMATVGGNMMQQTRCSYFYDTAFPCNKRQANSGCGAWEGINRMHAIFGVNEKRDHSSCIAVHPSDMSVALLALDAAVLVSGPQGERRIAFGDFHRLPGDRPELDTNLQKGELILAIEIPDAPLNRHIHYLKVRDRASYAFALVSVAVALEIHQNNIKTARLTMGGVAHKPWRLTEAESVLTGQHVSENIFRQAAEAAMRGAYALEHNAYKLKLAPNAIVEALRIAAGLV
jgi:xanthine dehydrogenase YagS FAD-binding subunit